MFCSTVVSCNIQTSVIYRSWFGRHNLKDEKLGVAFWDFCIIEHDFG